MGETAWLSPQYNSNFRKAKAECAPVSLLPAVWREEADGLGGVGDQSLLLLEEEGSREGTGQ